MKNTPYCYLRLQPHSFSQSGVVSTNAPKAQLQIVNCSQFDILPYSCHQYELANGQGALQHITNRDCQSIRKQNANQPKIVT